MNVKLLDDIFSYGKGRILYGSKGDIVKVIIDNGNVLIVEKSNKERFPVLRIYVKTMINNE